MKKDMNDIDSVTTPIEEQRDSIDVGSLSQVLFAVRPWESTQEMSQLIIAVIGIQRNGLTWGATTTEVVGFGISELLITAVIDTDKVSIDTILEDLVSLDSIISRVEIRMLNKVQ